MSAGDVTSTLEVRGRASMGNLPNSLDGLGGKVVVINEAVELAARLWGAFSSTMQASIGASREQTATFTHLEASLGRVGIRYSDVSGRLSDLFAETQRFTRFGDTDMASAMANIATATAALEPSIDTLEEYTVLAADLAEATKRDLIPASEMLAKAAAGDIESLAEVLPAYKAVLQEIAKIDDESERAAAALAILHSEFDGAARQVDAFDLAMSRLDNGIGDVLEGLGDTVTKSGQVSSNLAGMATQVDYLASALTDGAFSSFGDVIRTSAAIATNALAELFDFALTGMVRIAQAEAALSARVAQSQSAGAERAARTAEQVAAGRSVSQEDLIQLTRTLEAAGQDTAAATIRGGRASGGILAGGGGGFNEAAQQAAAEAVSGLRGVAEAYTDMATREADAILEMQAALEASRRQAIDAMNAADGGGSGGGGGGGRQPIGSVSIGDKDKRFATQNKATLQSDIDAQAAKDALVGQADGARLLLDVYSQVAMGFVDMEAAGGAALARIDAEAADAAERERERQRDIRQSRFDAADAVLEAGAKMAAGNDKLTKLFNVAQGARLFGEGLVQADTAIGYLLSGNYAGGVALLAQSAVTFTDAARLGFGGGGRRGGAGAQNQFGGGFTPVRDRAQQDRAEIRREQINILNIDRFISNDAETNRMLARGIRSEESLGGVYSRL